MTITVGVNADGRRKLLCMAVVSSEMEPFWLDFLSVLACRGLRVVKLVVFDGHLECEAGAAGGAGHPRSWPAELPTP